MPDLKAIRKDEPGALALLRDIRDLMAGKDATQAKLDKLVELIAGRLQFDVCSIYLLNPGHVLELFASYGLNKNAIHHTRLEVGQGLVGEIAATANIINIPEAEKHPKYFYKPETGEEVFKSFVGVPILSNHQVIGVLVVQGKIAKTCTELQIEVMQTLAMLLAEMATGQGLVDHHALFSDKEESVYSRPLPGQRLSPGLARAPAVLHRPRIEVTKLVAEDPAQEEERLNNAVDALRQSVDQLIENTSGIAGNEHTEILETYRMFAYDRGWLNNIVQAIHTGLTAEGAVKKVLEELHVRLQQIKNPYIRERIEDLEDLSTRLLYHLTGISPTAAHSSLPEAFILVAKYMGPAELLEYGHGRIRGLVLEQGSAASHITIISRMMDIPVVSGIHDATEIIAAGDTLVVDGDHGEVYIRPGEDLEKEINRHLVLRDRQNTEFALLRSEPPVTKDGVRISINLNIGFHFDAREAAASDIDGIGLYRTELPYLMANAFPDVESQRKIYADILEKAEGKPVIFRTFDIGGDKQVPYLKMPPEENPAMGWRATRIGLDRPLLLRRQLRALLEAGAGHELYVMFPMIATVQEYDTARALLDGEVASLSGSGAKLPSKIHCGAMLEVPSLIFEMPELVKRVQFISIGSNDLFQFLFAADRTNEQVAQRYDPLRPSIMRLLSGVVMQCRTAGVKVGFCGDMASRPLEAMALFAAGIDTVSIPPAAIGPLKAMIRTLDLGHISSYIGEVCTAQDKPYRQYLQAFAQDHGVMIPELG